MPTRRKQLEKQPSEIFPVDINFGTALPLGAQKLVSAVASAEKWQRTKPNVISDATTEILQSTTPALISHECEDQELRARIIVKEGLDDYDYKITVIGEFDDGSVLEEDIYVRVREV